MVLGFIGFLLIQVQHIFKPPGDIHGNMGNKQHSNLVPNCENGKIYDDLITSLFYYLLLN